MKKFAGILLMSWRKPIKKFRDGYKKVGDFETCCLNIAWNSECVDFTAMTCLVLFGRRSHEYINVLNLRLWCLDYLVAVCMNKFWMSKGLKHGGTWHIWSHSPHYSSWYVSRQVTNSGVKPFNLLHFSFNFILFTRILVIVWPKLLYDLPFFLSSCLLLC